MIDTATVRLEYPEPLPNWSYWTKPKCDHRLVVNGGPMVQIVFPAGPPDYQPGEVVALRVHHAQSEAWTAFATVMDTVGYRFGETAGGTVNCRKIGGGTLGRPSLHAYGSAIDLNPSKNRGTDTDQPAVFVAAVNAIRTRSGKQVFRNLPNDRMHWQIACFRSDLGTGVDWSTVVGADSTMEDDDVLWREGFKGQDSSFFRVLFSSSAELAGDPNYWASDRDTGRYPNGPSDDEWDVALPKMVRAFMDVAVDPAVGSTQQWRIQGDVSGTVTGVPI